MRLWKPLRVGDCRKALGSGLNLAPLLFFPLSSATAFSRSRRTRCVWREERSAVFALGTISDLLILGDPQALPRSLRFFRSVDENFLEWVLTVLSDGIYDALEWE
jgi:hypothetical protein